MEKVYVYRCGLRHCFLRCESGSYLVDMDTMWLGYLSPIFIWFFPHVGVKLSGEIPNHLLPGKYDEIGTYGTKGKPNTLPHMLVARIFIIPFLIILTQVIIHILAWTTQLPSNIVSIVLATAIGVAIKVHFSKKFKKHLLSKINIEPFSEQRFCLKPSVISAFNPVLSLWSFIWRFLVSLSILFLFIATYFLFPTQDDPIHFLAQLLSFFLISYSNFLLMSPDLEFHIKFIDKK